ncbi:flavodoxin domain-containing protein [Actinomyces sp. Marseille-P3109]|uniref:flavodoxin domain-containing protein n=1 Tax=Actinomyces sp. Marseille-P3109 TaxID=2083009 RepID=UPI000D560C4A|nr:flavodoxin domain-containing protein [Actinomyces sp. Marseille-P3109]
MKILLTSSSRHGSTDEVAAVIAERLQAAQIDVETRRPEDVDSVDGYDAFILGSAVYMTKWTPEAVDFTKRFHDALKARPVWAFSVGLSGLPQGKVADPMRIGPVLLAIDPEDHMTFAGRFDPSRLSLRERSIAKLGGATEGDYRDWDEVRQWADAIATSLYDDTLTARREHG